MRLISELKLVIRKCSLLKRSYRCWSSLVISFAQVGHFIFEKLVFVLFSNKLVLIIRFLKWAGWSMLFKMWEICWWQFWIVVEDHVHIFHYYHLFLRIRIDGQSIFGRSLFGTMFKDYLRRSKSLVPKLVCAKVNEIFQNFCRSKAVPKFV